MSRKRNRSCVTSAANHSMTLHEFNVHLEKEHEKKTASVLSGHENPLNVETSKGKVQSEIVEEDKKPEVCDECGEAFMDSDSFIAHKEEHRNETILCLCRFATEYSLLKTI